METHLNAALKRKGRVVVTFLQRVSSGGMSVDYTLNGHEHGQSFRRPEEVTVRSGYVLQVPRLLG